MAGSNPRLDAKLNTLVITSLEVQAVVVVSRAPVAPEQRLLRAEEDRHRHDAAPAQRELHHQALRQGAGDLTEERAREIRLVPVPQERIAVQCVDRVEERGIELPAEARFEVHTGFGDAPPLAA